MGRKRKQHKAKKKYPVATIIYYGPDDRTATKVAVGILQRPGQETEHLRRWYAPEVREDPSIQQEIAAFIQQHGVRSVLLAEGIFGCPHEEGIDYPEGQDCPHCSFWRGRPRDLGNVTLLSVGEATKPQKLTRQVAVAIYAREEWQRLREIAADGKDLEATWEEWQTTKDEEVARLRAQGFEVYEVRVELDALERYCSRRGIANTSAARAEYVAYRMQQRLDGEPLAW